MCCIVFSYIMEANHSSFRCILTFLAVGIYEMYASQIVYHMNEVADPYVRLIPTETGEYVVSTVGCATRCLRSNATCYSFDYNTRTKLCTMGSWLHNSLSPRESDTELFYQDSPCQQYVDFKLYSKGNVSSCLWISCTKLNYTDARKFCQDYNSTLYTMKVSEKIHILNETIRALRPSSSNGSWSWIGLNNMQKPDSYIWEDDGTQLMMSSVYKAVLFHAGQPSAPQTESCMSFDTTTYYPLHDYFCNASLIFVCEKDPRMKCI